jgi:hypothetical protein
MKTRKTGTAQAIHPDGVLVCGAIAHVQFYTGPRCRINIHAAIAYGCSAIHPRRLCVNQRNQQKKQGKDTVNDARHATSFVKTKLSSLIYKEKIIFCLVCFHEFKSKKSSFRLVPTPAEYV